MSIAIYGAIAVLIILLILWLLLQPKQGQTASNQTTETDNTTSASFPSPRQYTQSSAEIEQTVRELMIQGKKIAAIKYIRSQKGLGLRDAKNYVESLDDQLHQSVRQAEPVELRNVVKELLRQNKSILAIKHVRLKTGLGLKEAKEYVDKIKRESL